MIGNHNRWVCVLAKDISDGSNLLAWFGCKESEDDPDEDGNEERGHHTDG